MGLILGSGRPLGGGNGNPLQYSGLEKSHGQGSLVGYSPWGRRVGHGLAIEHTHWFVVFVRFALYPDDSMSH